MALDLSLLPDKPRSRQGPGNEPKRRQKTAGGLDLSLLPDREEEDEEPETEQLMLSRVVQPFREAASRALPAVIDLTERIPGSSILKDLEDLYTP